MPPSRPCRARQTPVQTGVTLFARAAWVALITDSGRISDGVKGAAANVSIFLGSLTQTYELVNGPLTGTPHFQETWSVRPAGPLGHGSGVQKAVDDPRRSDEA